MSQETEAQRELTAEEFALLVDLVQASADARAAEERARKAREQLAASMDFHTHGLINDEHVVTVSRYRPERFDVAGFRVDHELMARQYTRSADTDTIRVTPKSSTVLAIVNRLRSVP